MSDLTRIAGKPVTLTVGGQDYEFSPLTLDDFAEFEAWLLSEKLNRALTALGEQVTSEERVQVVTTMTDEISQMEVAKASQSMRGLRQMLWYSLRRTQPSLTRTEAAAVVNFDNLAEMTALVDELGSDAKKGKDESRPPAAKPSARGRRSS